MTALLSFALAKFAPLKFALPRSQPSNLVCVKSAFLRLAYRRLVRVLVNTWLQLTADFFARAIAKNRLRSHDCVIDNYTRRPMRRFLHRRDGRTLIETCYTAVLNCIDCTPHLTPYTPPS